MDRNEFRMQMEEEEQKERQWQEIVDYYGGQKDAKSQDNIVEMLREVQELYGYIPSEKTGAMADALGVKQTLNAPPRRKRLPPAWPTPVD